jgi:hypothetical protein
VTADIFNVIDNRAAERNLSVTAKTKK